MLTATCRRCRQPLTPIYPGQDEHPLCSPTPTGWIPRASWGQGELAAAEPMPPGLALALELAALGWHVFPLSPASKRPLANCPACTSHDPARCPCLTAGRWCHGVRAATTDPARLTAWWRDEPAAVPGIAAGPSGLVLIDIDAHHDQLPADLATRLLPGINLAAEPIPRERWDNPARFHDGRDTLRLLAALRGGNCPWPPGPACQPVTVATPSGGRHLWYKAPAPGLRQALSDPQGRYGLGWQIDIKAGWSHGLAPGATTRNSTYQVLSGNPASPGHMQPWLAREVLRVATPKPREPRPVPALPPTPGNRGAAYLTKVINRGAAQLAAMGQRGQDGRKRALAKLAYHVGGLLVWSGLPEHDVIDRLADAGTGSGLSLADARRITVGSLANGLDQPLTVPPAPGRTGRAA